MQVRKDLWDMFLTRNRFNMTPVHRNPITGDWPATGDEVLDVSHGIKKARMRHSTDPMIEIADEWLLPMTRKDRPPKPGERVHSYMISRQGFEANLEQIRRGYCYPKSSFEDFVKCLEANWKHYEQTLERRVACRSTESC